MKRNRLRALILLFSAFSLVGCGQIFGKGSNLASVYSQYKENGGKLSYDEWLQYIKEDHQEGSDEGTAGLTYFPLDDGTYGVSAGQAIYLSEIVIPEKHSGKYVTKITDRAFYNCISLYSITLPNSIVSIGAQAFRDCSSLTSVNIPNSVTSIGDNAFEGCDSLSFISIPNSVTSIGEWAFASSSSSMIICCEASEKPDGWSATWNHNYFPTGWGSKNYFEDNGSLYVLSADKK